MSLKKSRVIAIVGTFVLAFLCHFMYQLLPNFAFSIFFPVNESIWEHMKILYTSILLYGIVDFFVLKRVYSHNFFLNLFVLSFSSIVIYLALFLPIYYSIGENMFLAIGLMLVTYIIVYIMSYYILSMDEKNNMIIWILLMIMGYIILGYLTYRPFKNDLFFDPRDEVYGIKKR